nr:protein FAR1-related sequence 5-like [Tanacetum cinerariifolium]
NQVTKLKKGFHTLQQWLLIFLFMLRKKLERQGIRGPKPSFPHGNVKEMQKIQSAASTMKASRSSYGDFVGDDYTCVLFPYFEQWRKQYGESDAQMLINKMENRKMYNMKFVPFIGIDNHGKCVTLGSGMLLHEDTKSYTWLLNAFMTAFSHEPTMIVTDQDGAMKRAIEAVFKKAKHRLCMWHIM